MPRSRKMLIMLTVMGLLSPGAMATGEEVARDGGDGPTSIAIAEPAFLPSMAALPDRAQDQRGREIPRGDTEDGGAATEALSQDARREASAAPAPGPLTPTTFSSPSRNYAGITTGSTPPDPIGDVGPNHYVQAVNTSVAVFSKSDTSGAPVTGPTSLGSLFAPLGAPCNADRGDPVVLYDQLAGRWIIAQFAGAPNRICFAISTTTDPTASYTMYAFPTSQFPDYFKIGVWPDAYYVTWNQGPVGVAALERSQILVSGGAEILETSVSAHLGSNMMLPADADGAMPPAAGAPGIIYHHKDGAIAGGSDRIELRNVIPSFDGSPSSIFVTGPTGISMSPFDGNFCGGIEFVACIPQPGTAQKLDPIMEWPMWRLQYRNFTTHESLLGNFLTDVDGTDRAGIRWFELRRTPPAATGPWTLHQQGTHSPDDTNRWMGSIAMDGEGNIALGYSASDSISTYPSVWYAGRVADDALGTLPRGEVELFAGDTSQIGGYRWGDYASMNVDPVDDCTFWFTGELALAGIGQDTRIGAFKLCDTLTVLRDGSGTGTVTSSPAGISCPTDCVEGYNDGEIVTLTAAPGGGSAFTGWSGGGCAGTGSCMVTVDKAKNVTATFTRTNHQLSVSAAGGGSGLVTSSPSGISCPSDCAATFPVGTSVALTATPGPGSWFAGWSGSGCSGSGGCSVLMNQDRSVSALFQPVGGKSISLKAAKQKVPAGTKVRLTATVAPCGGHEGDQVRFQRKVKGGWKTFADKSSSASCTAKAKPKVKTTTRFRAVSPQQDVDHSEARSKPVRVRAV